MACKLDVKEAVIDKAFKDAFEGRHTFKRINMDTIEIVPSKKAKSARQAYQIAYERLNYIKSSTNGYVNGYISEYSDYEPITLTLTVDPSYVDYEYSLLPKERQTERDLSFFNGDVALLEQENKNVYYSLDEVDYQLKASKIITDNLEKILALEKKLSLSSTFWDKIQKDFQIPSPQMNLLKESKGITLEEKLSSFLANYSFSVEINTTKEKEGATSTSIDFENNPFLNPEDFQSNGKGNTKYYSNLKVPGGTNYIENEITTPVITPSIKGHAQFATNNGIGWFRSDEQAETVLEMYYAEYIEALDKYVVKSNTNGKISTVPGSYNFLELAEKQVNRMNKASQIRKLGEGIINSDGKTRRILEVQSDLFQKGRDKDILTRPIDNFGEPIEDIYLEGFEDMLKSGSDNKFLQLLNKDNNWVTFFVKSIIQDSAKKGYEKVLFPTGDTAAKVEGHDIKTFIRQKEENIERLEEAKNDPRVSGDDFQYYINDKGEFVKFPYGDTRDIIVVTKEEYKTEKEKEDTEIDKRISSLKKEVEDAKAGKSKISSIAKFYEETVFNVLKKQGYSPTRVTDEYGNEWYEVTPKDATIYLQVAGTIPSPATPQTISKVKEFLKRINVDVVTSKALIINGKKVAANGVADITRSLIDIVEGKEDVALPEEAMHFAVEILEQTNPALYRRMFNEVANYALYEKVKQAYKDIYLLPDGKMDIKKIKKETMGKILAEYYLSLQGQPLNEESVQQIAQTKSFFQQIVDWVISLFKKPGFNPFIESALEVDTLEGTFKGEGLFYQSTVPLKDKIAAKKNKYNLVKHENTPDPDDENNNSYYTVDVNGKPERVERTTDYAKKLIIKRNGGRDYFATETEENKKKSGQFALRGVEGHYVMESIIKNATDDDGFLKENIPPIDLSQFPLAKPISAKLEEYVMDLLRSYPLDTQFLVEQQLYNEKSERAGTVDLIVVMPDNKIKIFDWKFMGFSLDKYSDIPQQKQQQHAVQLGDYKRALKEAYGEKDVEAQTVPIHVQYAWIDNVPYMESIRIGNKNYREEKNTHLLPVMAEGQSTGNKEVDTLVSKLETYYKNLYKTSVSPEEKYLKKQEEERLLKGIRHLQIRMNFGQIALEAETFAETSRRKLDKYKDMDFFTLSDKDINIIAGELNDFEAAADVFFGLDETFISVYGSEDLLEEDKDTLETLRKASSVSKERAKEANIILGEMLEQMAKGRGVEGLLNTEKEFSGIINSFLDANNLPIKALNFLATLFTNLRSRDKIEVNKLTKAFQDVYLAAVKKYPKLYDQIADRDKLTLKKKVKQEFWDALKKAKEDGNRKFLIDNIDVAKYEQLSQEYIEKRTATINDTVYTGDKVADGKIRKREINQLSNSLLFMKPSFNGWSSGIFNHFINQSVIQDKHYTEEYKKIAQSPELLAVYSFIEEMNRRAFKTGYLSQGAGMNFLAFIKGSMLERLATSKNYGNTIKEFAQESYTLNVNEEQQYNKKDEKGNRNTRIPKFFTQRDKNEAAETYSTDLAKIIPQYIQAVIHYETSKNYEQVALGVVNIEKRKGHYEVGKDNNVIFEGDAPKIFEGNSKTSDQVLKEVYDQIYGITDTDDTLIDVGLDKITKGTEEDKEKTKLSAKKAINRANTYLQGLAVGLKLSVAIPNFVGAQMQSYINAGRYYNSTEFFKAERQLIFSSLTKEEKGLLDLITPLNENIAKDATRNISFKQSPVKWLSEWTINDVLMSTNRIPDILIQKANTLAFLRNSAIVDGKIVNITQYLKNEKDYRDRYGNNTVKEDEKAFITKKKEMMANSLVKQVSFNKEGYLEIPGVSEDEVARFRSMIIEYGRNITGQMSEENKAEYRRSIIQRSFSMFKNWIPKNLTLRGLDIKYNSMLDTWEYGRTRLFAKTLFHLGFKNIGNMRDIIAGNSKGQQIMSEILERKREEYYKKTGNVLNISEIDFYDMVRKEISAQMKELNVVMSLMALVLASKFAIPDDDESDYKKNQYRYYAKLINKISDEMFFYYSPTSTESITRGSFFPAISIFTRATKALKYGAKDVFGVDITSDGLLINDNEVREKTHSLKYFINLLPGASQFQNGVYPFLDPEGAKDAGIRVSPLARQGN